MKRLTDRQYGRLHRLIDEIDFGDSLSYLVPVKNLAQLIEKAEKISDSARNDGIYCNSRIIVLGN